MHTLIQGLMLATLIAISNQSHAELAPILDYTSPYVWVAQTVIPNGRVRVVITKQKPKLYLARSKYTVAKLLADNNDDDYYNDIPDFQVGYRRPELIDQTADTHSDISDEIQIRLALARMKAMAKYQEIWG